MATKADQARAKEEQSRARAHVKKSRKHVVLAARHKKAAGVVESKHADRKATVVQEEHSPSARPSRKSTRKASNRLTSDQNLVLRAEREARSPKRRARNAAAKATKVRGKPHTPRTRSRA
ncbi:MAG: hypothetical protein HYV09_33425 [Deltaproteobacteria bacterium]|nr:hypothetical protein [Deltaproteobacteria bacterium]